MDIFFIPLIVLTVSLVIAGNLYEMTPFGCTDWPGLGRASSVSPS